jgi:D-galactarolactone cycloisomerase
MNLKIEQIDVYVLKMPHHYRVGGHTDTPGRLPGSDYYIEPQWLHVYSRQVESCLVKITADNGAVGWGEAQAPVSPETACSLITTLLGPALLGSDPLATAAQYHRLYHLMLARGHTGSFLFDAIAGLDIALWDLKSRHYGAPLFELLGGPFTLQLPAYISGLRVKGLEEKRKLATELVGQGFVGVKLFTGASIDESTEEVLDIRSALGKEAVLAVDAICKYDLPQAIQLGTVLDEVAAAWFESPLDAEDIAGHAALARRLRTPVAVGETLRTARQFLPWIQQRALAIGQPDVMRAGITGTVRIAAQNATAHIPTALHTGVCSGIGMAATWQVAASLPMEVPQEHQFHLFECAMRLLKTPLSVDRGRLIVPTESGIGVVVDEEAVKRTATEYWTVTSEGRRQAQSSPNNG